MKITKVPFPLVIDIFEEGRIKFYSSYYEERYCMAVSKNERTSKIETLRKEKGYTRGQLSRTSDIPIRTLESWEYGTRIPRDVYQLRKLAQVFECSIEDLLDL